MQQVIDGKRYDTETAEKVASSPLQPTTDLNEGAPVPVHPMSGGQKPSLLRDTVKMFYQGKSPGAGDLYRTRKGNWFIHEWQSNQLIPVSHNEVRGWCEKFQLQEIVGKYLADEIEEA